MDDFLALGEVVAHGVCGADLADCLYQCKWVVDSMVLCCSMGWHFGIESTPGRNLMSRIAKYLLMEEITLEYKQVTVEWQGVKVIEATRRLYR